jgi:hypothetical protein
MVDAKIKQLIELKKQQNNQKEALKFSERYKKVKFVEKRKVIRMLEKECNQADKSKYEKWLSYINNFPQHWKYVSIFSADSPQKAEIMGKVLELADKKDRRREFEMIKADDDDYDAGDNKIFQREVEKEDPFFVDDD